MAKYKTSKVLIPTRTRAACKSGRITRSSDKKTDGVLLNFITIDAVATHATFGEDENEETKDRRVINREEGQNHIHVADHRRTADKGTHITYSLHMQQLTCICLIQKSLRWGPANTTVAGTASDR
jgi:hypothetical protein